LPHRNPIKHPVKLIVGNVIGLHALRQIHELDLVHDAFQPVRDSDRCIPPAARWRNQFLDGCLKSTEEARNPFLDGGLAALYQDARRPGRPPTITLAKVQEVIRKTTQEKPPNTHWSTRTMAEAAGLSEKSVRRIWRKYGLKPHLAPTFGSKAVKKVDRRSRRDSS
jgi:Homeodomain-like domain